MSTIIERLLKRDMSLLDDYTPQTTVMQDPQNKTRLQRDLDDIDVENPMTLYLIVSAIQQSQFKEAVPWVLDNLLSSSANSDSYCDPEARLFMHAELPIEMLKFCADAVPSRFALAAVIDSLISLDSDDEVYDACRKAVEVLGDTDFPSWVNFANEADFQGNSMVWYFCQHQARRVAPLAPRPSYMREVTERTLETTAPDLKMSVDDSPEEIAKKAKERSEDPELFRVWGPSNLLLGANADDVIDGTADLRMFTDDRFTPEDQGTWFTGSCDYCWLRIASPRYAVRKPIEAGGWRGQYCSWDCVRQDCQDFELAAFEMTFYYQKQCSEFGIYDHLFTNRNATLGEEAELDDDTMPTDRLLIP